MAAEKGEEDELGDEDDGPHQGQGEGDVVGGEREASRARGCGEDGVGLVENYGVEGYGAVQQFSAF